MRKLNKTNILKVQNCRAHLNYVEALREIAFVRFNLSMVCLSIDLFTVYFHEYSSF